MTGSGSQSFEPPSEELLSRVLSSIGDLQHRRAFYIQLRNPLWIEPLDKRRAFNNPPTPVQEPDGTWRRRPWPEGEYLARMHMRTMDRPPYLIGYQTKTDVSGVPQRMARDLNSIKVR